MPYSYNADISLLQGSEVLQVSKLQLQFQKKTMPALNKQYSFIMHITYDTFTMCVLCSMQILIQEFVYIVIQWLLIIREYTFLLVLLVLTYTAVYTKRTVIQGETCALAFTINSVNKAAVLLLHYHAAS